MRITPGVPSRLGVGALVLAAATGAVGVGTADAGEPTRALSCPGAVHVREAGDGWGFGTGTPRQQVLDMLPYSQPYTQAFMTGRLEERGVAGGEREVVARGKRHEPIAAFFFAPSQRGWSLRVSAECLTDHDATRAADPFNRVVCPGYVSDGIVDGSPFGPLDPATPQEKLREWERYVQIAHTRENAVGPRETRYRFEGTKAAVVTRDAYRRPIAVHRFYWSEAGWQLEQMDECSSYGPAGKLS